MGFLRRTKRKNSFQGLQATPSSCNPNTIEKSCDDSVGETLALEDQFYVEILDKEPKHNDIASPFDRLEASMGHLLGKIELTRSVSELTMDTLDFCEPPAALPLSHSKRKKKKHKRGSRRLHTPSRPIWRASCCNPLNSSPTGRYDAYYTRTKFAGKEVSFFSNLCGPEIPEELLVKEVRSYDGRLVTEQQAQNSYWRHMPFSSPSHKEEERVPTKDHHKRFARPDMDNTTAVHTDGATTGSKRRFWQLKNAFKRERSLPKISKMERWKPGDDLRHVESLCN